MSTWLRVLATALALALALVACAEGDGTADVPADTPAEDTDGTTDEPADTEPEDDTVAAGTVAVATTDLGDVLVDGDGMTVYIFDPDEQSDPTCYDDCASNWPPFVVDGEAEAGEGADSSLVGTVERTDGSTQVTYDGWPLYYWQGDEAAGDTNGQGVGDVWWVIGPDGEPLRDAS